MRDESNNKTRTLQRCPVGGKDSCEKCEIKELQKKSLHSSRERTGQAGALPALVMAGLWQGGACFRAGGAVRNWRVVFITFVAPEEGLGPPLRKASEDGHTTPVVIVRG